MGTEVKRSAPASRTGTPRRAGAGLEVSGLAPQSAVHWNLTPPELYEHALRRGEGVIAERGPFCAVTTPHTGRSPGDKFLVREPGSADHIWWGKVNQPLEPAHFERLQQHVVRHLDAQELFVRDVYAGADPAYRLPIRFITPNAWQALFVHNMFLRPTLSELVDFTPGFQVLHAPECLADPAAHGTKSGTVIAVNPAKRTILIGGTRYAGELKKSIFTILNYLMPRQGVLSMHCSANLGETGDVALFFGLSGTGKTTLSADPERKLIGDDEHGWGDSGVFNIEGGCYAKVIHLSPVAEPEIYNTTRTFGTILENVAIDEQGIVDLDDDSKTENTRAAYKLEQIANALPSKMAGHPTSVIFLTADAFGILPPIAKLSNAQALYFFLSGFTAKLAGTEIGVTEPQPTFSTCFGQPFLPQHPKVYARMLDAKLEQHGSTVWLLNTGWTGGPFGEGERMPIQAPRTMLTAALSGRLGSVDFRTDALFGFQVPTAVPGVESRLLDPRSTWRDPEQYDRKARALAQLFADNFARRFGDVGESVRAAGPNL